MTDLLCNMNKNFFAFDLEVRAASGGKGTRREKTVLLLRK